MAVQNRLKRTAIIITAGLLLLLLSSCSYDGADGEQANVSASVKHITAEDVPEYEGDPYVTVNGNEPEFSDELKTGDDFEVYGELDNQSRCTAAIASLSVDTQPAGNEERGDISSVHPSGWKSGMGWERCHLIGWQLCAENANERTLVTGTHYMNVTGMLPF